MTRLIRFLGSEPSMSGALIAACVIDLVLGNYLLGAWFGILGTAGTMRSLRLV